MKAEPFGLFNLGGKKNIGLVRMDFCKFEKGKNGQRSCYNEDTVQLVPIPWVFAKL